MFEVAFVQIPLYIDSFFIHENMQMDAETFEEVKCHLSNIAPGLTSWFACFKEKGSAWL